MSMAWQYMYTLDNGKELWDGLFNTKKLLFESYSYRDMVLNSSVWLVFPLRLHNLEHFYYNVVHDGHKISKLKQYSLQSHSYEIRNKDWKFVNLNVSNYNQHYIHKQTLSLAYFDDITFKTIYLSYIHLKQCIRALLWVIKDFKQLLVSICMYVYTF